MYKQTIEIKSEIRKILELAMVSANARSNVDNELGFIEVQVSEMQDTEAPKKTSLIHQWLWINTQDIAEKTKFSEASTST